MKIGIIGAMEQEVADLRQQLTDSSTLSLAGCEIYTGRLHNHDIALLKSGIGKTAAAIGTALLSQQCQPDFIINTGSAGGLAGSLNVGDIIIADKVAYHDADVTAFGYQPGQMAGCPRYFEADSHLITRVRRSVAVLALHAVEGLVVSGDSFINGAEPLNRIRNTFPDAIAVEMEAAAIGHVCSRFAIPFVVVRAISDVADKASHQSFQQFIEIAARQSSLMVADIIASLNDNSGR